MTRKRKKIEKWPTEKNTEKSEQAGDQGDLVSDKDTAFSLTTSVICTLISNEWWQVNAFSIHLWPNELTQLPVSPITTDQKWSENLYFLDIR